MKVRIPPTWREHEVGDVRATHVVQRIRRDEWAGGDGVPIQVVHLRGSESDGMLGIVIDGSRFYCKSYAPGEFSGGAIVDDRPTAVVARITDAGCVVEIRDVKDLVG